jgi:hypothetical protein
MKPKDILNVVVAGFGLYSLWKGFACAVTVALINLGICPEAESSKGYYLAWFVIGLVLGIVLLRYGAQFLSWILPAHWPASDTSKPEQP